MTTVRRIAAAALLAALSVGAVGTTIAPASAVDTSWGAKVKAR